MGLRTFMILVGLAGLAIALAGCRTEDKPSAVSPVTEPTATPAPEASPADSVPSDGGPVPELPEPVRVTEGDWVPPALGEEATQRGEDLFLDLVQTRDAPTSVELNGFTVGPYDEWVPNLPCSTSEAKIEKQSPLMVGYLPPNTYETHERQTITCPSDEIWMTVLTFRVSLAYQGADTIGSRAEIRVAYFDRTRALPVPSLQVHEVKAGRVNGRDALFIMPISEDGYGQSMILFATGDSEIGFFEVQAFNLPFEELLKIAEGLSCTEC